MASPYLGEIRIFAGNFAPKGWATCNGQILPLSQNTALFSLLGTMYGGNGTNNFALPNLQGSAPLQAGQGSGLSRRNVGDAGGETSVTLSLVQMPQHNHPVNANNTAGGDRTDPTNTVWSSALVGRQGTNLYKAPTLNTTPMNPLAVAATGSSAPHTNMPPFLTLTFIIALQGIYPQRA
ncbi:MAG TPA: tail fiber protein [Candidatus Dormibacteraeota bacterium]|jgi:microcystin-dependent protein|nr:tail fiber protein [Candidatus Dormibacteraeota bacterium]